jgi:uroporphyrinogen III methyltransferase / synthase
MPLHDVADSARRNAPPPRVALVGAGPGDPGLITLRGDRLLREADVVLYDYLANPQLLEACRRDAELVCLGKHGRDRILSQDEVNERLVAAARAGRRVVRLKAGDPAVFARFGEEVAALEAAGIAYEVVPGITAALAAGSHAGVPITDRRAASAVALVTGHEQDDGESTLDYAALAAFPGTLVFYMGVTRAAVWTKALIDAGKPATTTTAVIRRCSWPDQRTIVTTLGKLAAMIEAEHLRPPVIVVVGDVVECRAAGSWFTDRPLFGRRVLFTRPEEAGGAADAARTRLRDLGAEVVTQPAIQLGDLDDWHLLDDALGRLKHFDWIVFSSANGVRAAMRRLWHLGGDGRALGSAKIAAIGPATAEALAAYHLRADRVPPEYRAESLAEMLAGELPGGGKRFLLVRASRGREVLADTLRAAGAEVEQVVAYKSTDVAEPDAEIAAMLEAGKIDWITVTSSAIARSLAAMLGPQLNRAKLASISPITSATLAELGFRPAAEATTYTLDGLIDAIVRAES